MVRIPFYYDTQDLKTDNILMHMFTVHVKTILIRCEYSSFISFELDSADHIRFMITENYIIVKHLTIDYIKLNIKKVTEPTSCDAKVARRQYLDNYEMISYIRGGY